MATDPYHYPAELVSMLVDTIPLLHRSKQDTIGFFRGRGVAMRHLADLQARLDRDSRSIGKYEIARVAVNRMNQAGDEGLRARREVVRAVVEWENFSTCWPNDALKAEVNVGKIRKAVDAKDAFTRIEQERNRERIERLRPQREAAEALQQKNAERAALLRDLTALFALKNPQKRGLRFEGVLNRIFALDGLGLRDGFTLVGEDGHTVEQIDGLIELANTPYLVEAKWLKDPLGTDGVSSHLVRVYNRAGVHGLVVSASGFSQAAIDQCKTALVQRTIVLAELREIVLLLESGGNFAEWLKAKTYAASVDRKPFYVPS